MSKYERYWVVNAVITDATSINNELIIISH